MSSENNAAQSKQTSDVNAKNSLITKIALFLNYLSKDNHEKLLRDIQKSDSPAQVDILKLMLEKKYVSQKDIADLKKTCLSFAKAQSDMRFGSLCIDFGFLTQSNLNLALEEQARLSQAGQHIMLGDLLVDAGMLSVRQRTLILQKQKLNNVVSKTAAPDTQQEKQTDNQADNKTDSFPEDIAQESLPTFNKAHMREIRESEIIIYIQNDALKAFIQKTDTFDKDMLLSDLKFLLEKNGIIYGISDDSRLEDFIENDTYLETPFEAANGIDAVDGTDAQVIYMFEKDYLKPGALAEDGTIDFKDRGDIPFVKQGDVLAEKIPPKPGKDGITVYGDTILKKAPADLSFRLGKNVSLSRDGLKVTSDVEGNPKLSQTDELSVNDAYFIEGDVDYTTGHIKFDKNVFITGSIKSGFRVEAIDVVASTIDGGIVKAEGNVFVQNGVTESTIEAKGNIRASFMHRSQAACMGNMNIVKEIADTKVIIEGTFEMPRGKMFSSSVCARGGVKIYNIGSEKAKPSTITVGTSMYFDKEMASIDQNIETRQRLLESKTLDKDKIEAQLIEINERMAAYDKSRKRTLSMIQEVKKNSPDKTDLFQKSLDEAEQKIQDLRDQKFVLDNRMKKIDQAIERCSDAVKVSVKEKLTLKRRNKNNPAKPIVEVSGKALAGTRINGKHAKLVLNHTVSRSRIMEMNTDTPEGSRKGWEMIISNI
ncbi:MAG: FapA family protein [Proteobacteria bacterium]|nr:FapA family protein [Pseudomonadota bacterium]MBU1388342.1 FapA family protein [Pseudomonadota bacterium]MBU1542834.1 FapA family protein [Pseudomonadota bacterium]MBU2430704.1 FapA family protein [Pseudomonadota bacterium]MBU2482953.1 FapA family protein [Pseudomonadota bacterium]